MVDILLINQEKHNLSLRDKEVGQPTSLDRISSSITMRLLGLVVHTEIMAVRTTQ